MATNYEKIYEDIDAKHPNLSRRSLAPRATALAEGLKGCDDIELLQRLGRRERERLQTRHSPDSLGTALSSAGYYKAFRVIADETNSIIEDGKAKHAFIIGCGLSDEEWNERNESTNKIDRLSNPVDIDPTEALDTTAKLLSSDTWSELAAGLVLATGRRPHEIVLSGELDLIEGDEYHAIFSGQGKKRGEKVSFKIATLLPAKDVRHALHRLRKDGHVSEVLKEVRRKFPLRGSEEKKYEAEKRRNDEIDKRTNKPINRAVKSELGKVITARYGEQENNCKGLRAAYLAMAVRRDCDRNATPGEEMLQAARYAGHFVDGEKPSDSQLRHLVTTIGYSDYRVIADVPHWQAETTKRLGGEIYESDIDQITEWHEVWGMSTTAETVRQIIEYAKRGMVALVKPSETKTEAEPTEQETEPMTQSSDQRIDLLESQMQQMMEVIKTIASGQTVPQTEPSSEAIGTTEPTELETETKPEPKPWSRPWDIVHKDELFGLGEFDRPARGTGASDERVFRVIDALIAWNNQIGVDGDISKKWQIANSTIRDVAGVNGMVVKRVLEEYPDWNEKVSQHNAMHGIESDFHNRTHHTGEDVKEQVFDLIAANRN